MKYSKILLVVTGLLTVSMCSSCYSDSYGYAPATKRGAVAGGLIGAGLGTVIGSQSHRPLEGAAIGGAIGALSGAALGSARDDLARHQPFYTQPQSYRQPQSYNISVRYGRYPVRLHDHCYSSPYRHHSPYRHPLPSRHVRFHH
ncbi:MAG: hypothetical protein GY899_15960 [Verrucomicrobiaceae bacterium]|nr:hypothetical protein [Verrucomicrobiaceae bacterium]